jgi:hypothetical protein
LLSGVLRHFAVKRQVARERYGQFVAAGMNLGPEVLLAAVEKICGIPRAEFCGSGKHVSSSIAKELFALAGCQMGASLQKLSEIAGMSSAAMSRRKDAGRARMRENKEVANLVARIVEECRQS